MRLEATAPLRSAVPGIHCSGADGVTQRIAEGFRFCALASELRYMLSGLRADLAELNWSAAEGAEIGESVGGGGPLLKRLAANIRC